MATPPEQFTGTERFIHRLTTRDDLPTWHDAAALGVELVDFDMERRALTERITNANAYYAEHADQLETQGGVHTAEAYVESLEQRLDLLAGDPGRYHLATGEIIVLTADSRREAYQSGWWFNDDAVSVTTPNGQRFHHAGVHPDVVVDPTADIDPTARIEAGAVIGAHSRIGPYAHVGRGTMIDTHCIIQDGSWIGPGSELWPRTRVSPGATIGAHSVIGTRTTVGAGAQVAQGSQIEPFSRLGTGTTTANRRNGNRGIQIAGAIDQLMRLDRD
ncbi:MAG TPA: hypothetical protein VNQ73_16625 [Ilumatobacter sp.]|nr:hypothetical protein [Ilumatobacter sp.]